MFLFNRKTYRKKSDEELVAIYKNEPQSECIGVLYERYGHLVIGSCLKYLKNVSDAEDMAMQIFEGLPKKIIKHEITYFKSWLYMVTKNECFMLLRKKNVNVAFIDLIESNDESISDESIIKEQKLILMEEMIPLLKADQRICVELFYLKELSYQQISDQLNLSLMQVKSAIQNGKRNLKLRLEERNEFK
jgi:RNA polymerase sigma-70 factor (ECF subfamily)